MCIVLHPILRALYGLFTGGPAASTSCVPRVTVSPVLFVFSRSVLRTAAVAAAAMARACKTCVRARARTTQRRRRSLPGKRARFAGMARGRGEKTANERCCKIYTHNSPRTSSYVLLLFSTGITRSSLNLQSPTYFFSSTLVCHPCRITPFYSPGYGEFRRLPSVFSISLFRLTRRHTHIHPSV